MMSMHLGVTLYALGQPDPSVAWESVFKTLAGVEMAGMPLALALICAGVAFLVFGAVSHLRSQTPSSSRKPL
jgi:hypothetical protein